MKRNVAEAWRESPAPLPLLRNCGVDSTAAGEGESRAAWAHSSPEKQSDIKQSKGGNKTAIYSYLTNCSPDDIFSYGCK